MLFLAVGVTVGLLGSLCVPTHLAPLASAAHMISEGDYARALKLLRELPGERLDQWEMDRVRLQKGLCYRALGRYGEAVAAFVHDLAQEVFSI